MTSEGKSVKPYQPEGYWRHLNFPARKWQAGQGNDLYRRGLYTFHCRSFTHPAMLAFDAPSREECSAERPRSNIPQQALVLRMIQYSWKQPVYLQRKSLKVLNLAMRIKFHSLFNMPSLANPARRKQRSFVNCLKIKREIQKRPKGCHGSAQNRHESIRYFD